MRKIYLSPLFLVLFTSLWGQNCPECRYMSYVFDSVEVEQAVKFGEGVNADGNLQELYMDVYLPYGDTVSQRPVLVFAFGGGFIQGNREEQYVKAACRRFARSGYVAAAIDYRIGFDWLGILPNPAEELMRLFFRPMQDMRGAIQYFRAHADLMGNTYRIDPDQIYSGGASSGGITALMVSHCDKASEFAEIADTSAISSLGGFYSSSGLYPQYSWETGGVFNIAGALVNANWIEAGDAPIFNAHGDQDQTVPYMGGNLDLGFTSVGLEGSFLVDAAADSAGVCSYLYTIVGGGHPSGSVTDEYIDNVIARALPRFEGVIQGRKFCKDLEVTITPNGDGGLNATSPGAAVTLQAQIQNDQGNASLQWCSLECGFSSTQSTVSVSPVSLPAYIIARVKEDSSQATDYTVLDVAVSRDNPWEGLTLQYGPNPFQNNLNINFQNSSPGNFELEILTATGKQIYHRSLNLRNDASLSISTESWAQGLYFLRLKGNGNSWTEKLVKAGN